MPLSRRSARRRNRVGFEPRWRDRLRAAPPALGLLVSVLGGCSGDGAAEVSFSRDVQPILQEHCVACHAEGGVGVERSGRKLDSYEEIMHGSGANSIVDAGSASTSRLVLYVHSSADPNMRMPYGGGTELNKKQIETIRRWVDQGAQNN